MYDEFDGGYSSNYAYDPVADSYNGQAVGGPRGDIRNTAAWQAQNYANGFLSGNSPFYKRAADSMFNTMQRSSPTLNSLLGSALSGGLGYGASAAVANQQRRAQTQRNMDAVSKAMPSMINQGAGIGAGLLGQSMSYQMQQQQLAEQKRQFDESQPGFWDYALGIVSGGASMFASPIANAFSPQQPQTNNWNPGMTPGSNNYGQSMSTWYNPGGGI